MSSAVAPLRPFARLRHWSRIPPAELGDVVVAELALLQAQLAAWRRPRGQLVRPHDDARASREAPAACTPAELAERARTARRAVTALDRALRWGVVRPACLVRSLALVRLLERHGVHGAAIRLGVRRGAAAEARHARAAGDVDAHAWVELDGRVVGDDPRHTRRFTPIGGVQAVERR